MENLLSILIVDDEVGMRDLLDKILSRDGYRVLLAGDGEEALEVLKNESPQLVITDMKMPGMGGFDLLRVIKKDYPGVGVIMMTAYGDTYTVKDALLLGADEYITKPFKSHEISLVVERAYRRLLSAPKEDTERA
ncbi:MAG: response regulator [Candidatus Zixiibacteriota bacterium]|nr:MAG: response regulator [candidate division Zixibacteria bacterium]